MLVRSLALVSALLTLSSPLLADTYTYTYTGNHFTQSDTPAITTSDFVSGYFTTTSPLAPDLNPNGNFTAATALPVTSFSFSNGNQTVTNTNSSQSPLASEGIWVETDSTGNLVGWLVQLATIGNAGNGPFSYFAVQTDNWYQNGYAPGNTDIFSTDFGQVPTVVFGENEALGAGNGHDPGTWTVSDTPGTPAPVPEPATLSLFGTGALGLAEALRRRGSKIAAICKRPNRGAALATVAVLLACGSHAAFAQTPSSLNVSPALAATSSSSSFDPDADAAPAHRASAVLNSAKPVPGPIRPFSTAGVAVTVGFLGIGGQVAVPLSERTNLRGEGNFFSYNSASYTNDGITYKGKLKLRSAEMLLDWFPFHGSFRLSPGVEIYNGLNAAANLSVPSGRSFTLNHVSYYSSATKPITGTGLLTTRKAAPMFTLGWGNIVPRHGHLSVPFEVGFIYQGAPKVALTMAGDACDSPGVNCRPAATDSGIQSNLAAQQKVVSDDVGQYFRFYPVVTSGISYKF